MARRKAAAPVALPPKGPAAIDGVPTVEGLAAKSRDLAYRRADGKFYVTPAGHAAMGAALRARAQAAIAAGEHIWTRPPSSGQERNH